MVQLPDRINRLVELAYDLWWSWTIEAREVFRTLDYPLWRLTAHNPVKMLHVIPPATLDAVARDPDRLARYDRASASLDAARSTRNTWFAPNCHGTEGRSIAYYSAEFALHQSLPI